MIVVTAPDPTFFDALDAMSARPERIVMDPNPPATTPPPVAPVAEHPALDPIVPAPELKAGKGTTEFYVTLATILLASVLAALEALPKDGQISKQDAATLMAVAGLNALIYGLSRTFLKSKVLSNGGSA